MEQEVKKFLQAEETAEKLVNTLQKLHTEATSYKTAKGELDKVREKLSTLIQSTKDAVHGSIEIIKLLKEIGGPEILERFTTMEDKSSERFSIQSKSSKKLQILIIITLSSSIIAIVIGIFTLLK